MTDLANSSNLANRPQDVTVEIERIEASLIDFLEEQGLPNQSVLVSIDERTAVFRNITSVLTKIDNEQKARSIYISKFIAAVASGLFDAALNYLWNETIVELRNRVSQYDLSYFYDNVLSPEKRKKINNESHLNQVSDSELIEGARKIGLISDLGFQHLDYVRYMRNWVSAAHPNQNDITGLQLIAWLETCVKEVISLPLPNSAVEIKRLLSNIKKNNISETEAKQIASFFLELTPEQANNLGSGFFGIYTHDDTTSQTRDNIHKLLPRLWGRVDETTRNQFGVKYGKFIANNDQIQADRSRQFLEVVSGIYYIPDGLRAADIDTAVDNLLDAHRGFNNFYSEPPFARQLQRIIGDQGSVPTQVKEKYTLALVEVFMTNGNGVSDNALPVYEVLINQFDESQALTTVLSFEKPQIYKKLQHELCQKKYRELLELMKTKVSAGAVKELIDEIDNYEGPLNKLKSQSDFQKKLEDLKKIIG
ncbi:MAG: hypothetical protein F6K20_28480 [Moorea sp. SIO2C4]|nr:hypothetical protein [Moorena sp. SIO2C4]